MTASGAERIGMGGEVHRVALDPLEHAGGKDHAVPRDLGQAVEANLELAHPVGAERDHVAAVDVEPAHR